MNDAFPPDPQSPSRSESPQKIQAELWNDETQLPDETELESDEILDPNGVTQELTAYLDGELSPAEVTRVEQRLIDDPIYLAQMQSLQRTWEAFDAIANEEVGDPFMRTTMEMVVADAKSLVHSTTLNKLRWWRPMFAMLIPLLIFCVSYASSRHVQTRPHRTLVENLDLIERIDQYQKVNLDFEFLLKLHQRELFADNNLFGFDALENLSDVVGRLDQKPESTATVPSTPEGRLNAMNLAETQQLKLNYETYLRQTAPQLAQLEEFHQQLNQHPDRAQLLTVLKKYYQWLKSLGATDKARLLDSDPGSRLEEIAKLRSEQSRVALGRQGATKLPLDRDEVYLMNWFDFSIKSNEGLFRREFPIIVSEYQRNSLTTAQVPLEQLRLFARRAPLRQLVSILIRANRHYIQDIIYRDIDLLRRGLSYEALLIMGDQDPENQKTLILNWIEAANQAKTTIPEEKLQAFYEQLPADQRDELDRMSMEDWTSTLSRMYREKYSSQRADEESLFFDGF